MTAFLWFSGTASWDFSVGRLIIDMSSKFHVVKWNGLRGLNFQSVELLEFHACEYSNSVPIGQNQVHLWRVSRNGYNQNQVKMADFLVCLFFFLLVFFLPGKLRLFCGPAHNRHVYQISCCDVKLALGAEFFFYFVQNMMNHQTLPNENHSNPFLFSRDGWEPNQVLASGWYWPYFKVSDQIIVEAANTSQRY